MPRRRIIKKINDINDINSDIPFEDHIDKILYINLDNRKDRNQEIIKEFERINLDKNKIVRIDAVKKDIGAIGCALSHIKSLDLAIKNNYKSILILEDDFVFTKNKKIIDNLFSKLYQDEPDFNVCLLAGNIQQVSRRNQFLKECISVQTTSGYVIQNKFFKTLRDKFMEGVIKMEKNYRYGDAEADVVWKELQGKNKKFYIFDPKVGKQRASYSDIEKRHTNYNC